jgi:hypothetical protein
MDTYNSFERLLARFDCLQQRHFDGMLSDGFDLRRDVLFIITSIPERVIVPPLS